MKEFLILGGNGFIGRAISSVRPLWRWTHHHQQQLNLLDYNAVSRASDILGRDYDVIINAAGYYGGLPFNQQHGADILYQNSIINANVCRLVRELKPAKFINIGSACVYPQNATHTLDESQIGSGTPHPSVIYSAKSKMHMLDMMDTMGVPWEFLIVGNVYGPGEHLDAERSHVVGGLINKIKAANTVLEVMGTGAAVRDFIYVKDMAEAVCRYAWRPESTNSISNISSGQGTEIRDIVNTLVEVSGKPLSTKWGTPDQDGIAYKVLNNQKMILDTGYQPSTPLTQGLAATWKWANSQGKK
jgi:nucleoside-diphosphate-sugar epimerase